MRFPLTAAAGRAAHDGFGGATLETLTGIVADGAGRVADGEGRVIAPDSLAIDPALRPVRICQGAMGPGVPSADLLVAGGQRVLVDGVAVRAAGLVNGVSVRREAAGEKPVVYAPLAEGVAVVVAGVICVGGVGWGRAGVAALPVPAGFVAGEMIGNIAVADRVGVEGWAMDRGHPGVPVLLAVRLGGRAVARVLADRRRPDLEMAGLGDGRCGFRWRFARRLAGDRAHLVEIVRVSDGAAVPGSPLLVPPADAGRLELGGLEMGLAGVDAVVADVLAADVLAAGVAGLLQARAERD